MRSIVALLLLSMWASAQTSSPSVEAPSSPASQNSSPQDPTKPTVTEPSPAALVPTSSAPTPVNQNTVMVPAGTKIALELKHAISTKGTQEGAAVYAETTFPFALNDRILIPAGTYVQGRISRIERGGHIKGRAEVLMHFTTLIYPSGYTVVLPGSLENAPGIDKTKVKDKEGTLQQDSQAGDEATTIGTSAASGATIGALSQGAKGALIGGAVGGAIGTAIALMGRGRDVSLPAGTTFEMVIQREVALDPNRISVTAK